LVTRRLLPGTRALPTALAGNSKGDRARKGADSKALPKSSVFDGPTPHEKETTRKCGGDKSDCRETTGKTGSASHSTGLPGPARLLERATSIIRSNRYRGFDCSFTTGERTWCIRTDTSRGRTRATGTETRSSRNSSIRRPVLTPSGDAWPQLNCTWHRQLLDGTLLLDDSTRDGIGTRIPLSI